MRSRILNKRSLALVLLLSVAAPTSYVALKVYRYKSYIWMSDYFLNAQSNKVDNIRNGHVLFLIADHHEPGFRERAAKEIPLGANVKRVTLKGSTMTLGILFSTPGFILVII